MINKIDRRDFLRTGLTALAGTALGFYPTQARAQSNLATQLRDIEQYVKERPTKMGERGVVIRRPFFQNVPSVEYKGSDFGVSIHDYGILIDDYSGDIRRLFYDSRSNGLGTLDAMIDLPKTRLDLDDENIRAFLFGSDGALMSMVGSVDKRRNEIRNGQKSVWDETVVKRRFRDDDIIVYDFPNKNRRPLSVQESEMALNDMQDTYQEAVEKIHRQIRSHVP